MKKRGEKRNLLLILIVLTSLILIPLALAIPQSFTINGRLTNPNSVPLEGTYAMNFSVYDALTSGNLLWSSGNQNVATDLNGVYNVVLNPTNLNFSDNYFLGVVVAGESLTPRINITSSAYSFRAQNITVSGVEFTSNVNLGSQNITTTGTGFFAYLGSLVSRITGLFVQDADFNGTISFTGNINGSGNFTTTGRIGIGTATPGTALNILNGEVNITGTSPADANAPNVLVVTGGAGAISSPGYNGSNIILTAGAGGMGGGSRVGGVGGKISLISGSAGVSAAGSPNGGDIELTTGVGGNTGSYGNILLAKNGGKVYIGTATSLGTEVLQVNGTAFIQGNLNITGSAGTSDGGENALNILVVTGGTGGGSAEGNAGNGSSSILTAGAGGISGTGTGGKGGGFVLTSGTGGNSLVGTSGSGGDIELTTGAGGGTGGSYGNVILAKNGGNVYVGTSTSLGTGVLQINGSTLIKGDLNITGRLIGNTSSLVQYQFTNNNFNGTGNFTTTGRIGIGTASPLTALNILNGEVNITGTSSATGNAPDVLTIIGGKGVTSATIAGNGSGGILTAGAGGIGSTATGVGGKGGGFVITSGAGGVAATGLGGGAGGNIELTTGVGGASGGLPGNGGDIELTLGAGGGAGGAGNGIYGNIILAKNGGNIYIGTSTSLGTGVLQVNGSAVIIGNVTASYFIGDGSRLSNVNVSTTYAKYQFLGNNFNGTGNFTTTGRIGIGTASPTHALNVVGNANITGNYTTTTGRIGIGTASPVTALNILNGEVNVTGTSVTSDSANAPDVLTIVGGTGGMAGPSGIAGNGSSGILTAGNGGTSGTGTGGKGGSWTIISGAGGISGTGTGGKGGGFVLTSGTGGNSLVGTSGSGGDIELTTGAGGVGDPYGAYGNVILVKNGGITYIGSNTGTSLYINPTGGAGSDPLINTTAGNVTITSAGGSVIIRLG